MNCKWHPRNVWLLDSMYDNSFLLLYNFNLLQKYSRVIIWRLQILILWYMVQLYYIVQHSNIMHNYIDFIAKSENQNPVGVFHFLWVGVWKDPCLLALPIQVQITRNSTQWMIYNTNQCWRNYRATSFLSWSYYWSYHHLMHCSFAAVLHGTTVCEISMEPRIQRPVLDQPGEGQALKLLEEPGDLDS